MREAIYMERNWELAHEGKRWFGLVRRNALEPGYFATALPLTEVSLNRALTQNAGY